MLRLTHNKEEIIPTSDVLSAKQTWETRFEACEGVRRVTYDDFSSLKKLLRNCEEIDSYLSSPVYYLYTGRRGLWLYEREGAFIFVCRHPNDEERILIFPQLGNKDSDLLSELLKTMPVPSEAISIARARPSKKIEHYTISTDARKIVLDKKEEKILDWRYPVHILATGKVSKLLGGKYMYIRNRIRQLEKKAVRILPFDGIQHSRSVENLLHHWATHNAANREEYEFLYAPYESVFSLATDPMSGLSGIMIFVDDKLQALGLWDVSNVYRETANLFVNFCNVGITGLSDLLMVKCCETLHNNGVGYLNLGGSESEGLDRFKRKYDPAVSINLSSLAVEIEELGIGTVKPGALDEEKEVV